MKIKLEKFVDNDWYEYGIYNLSNFSDVKSYTEAVILNSQYFKSEQLN